MGSSEASLVWKRKGGKEMMNMEDEEEKTHQNHHGCCNHDNDDRNHQQKTEKKNAKRYGLLKYWELPEYMKDNEFILGYYRSNWPIKVAFFSLFRWHNETINIWTHLIGFVVFLGLTIANLVEVPQVADLLSRFTRSLLIIPATNASHNSKDLFLGASSFMQIGNFTENLTTTSLVTAATRWPFFVFLGGSMFCLLTSSTCHLLCCHSHRLNIFLLQMDYVGIAVMIITSFFPPIYYIFQCNPLWQVIYLSGVTIMGGFTIFTLLSPAMSTGKFRQFRAFLFASMGCFGIVPAVHAVIVNWSEPRKVITLGYEMGMAMSYVTGTLFYVTRIPERWKPGWFDLAGHSHQIFHVFVIMGALSHYAAALVFLDWRDSVGCSTIQ